MTEHPDTAFWKKASAEEWSARMEQIDAGAEGRPIRCTVTEADIGFLRGLALNASVHNQGDQNRMDDFVDRLIYRDSVASKPKELDLMKALIKSLRESA